jgi:cytochrome bd-type quinol oxidase subunit 2
MDGVKEDGMSRSDEQAPVASSGREHVVTTSAEDTRRPAYGFGRVLILVYGIFAVAATARAGVQLITKADEAPLAYALSAVAGLVYVLATVALGHNGRRMRRVGWTAVVFELVGVATVGTLSLVRPELFPDDTVWSGFGSGYGYVPAVLPVLGIAWLWHSSPGRIAARAEQR